MSLSGKVGKAELDRLQKLVRELQSKVQPDSHKATTTPFLTMHHGEDQRLVIEAWTRENPIAPELMVINIIWGEIPRPEYCTSESILDALPNAKAFHQQLGNGYGVKEWRELAKLSGVDYDAVEAVRPLSGTVQ